MFTWHSYGIGIYPTQVSPSSSSRTVIVGEVDELEEDVGWSISFLERVMDVEEGKLEEELVDKPGTIMAICFTVIDGVRLLVEEVHDNFSHILFEAILVRISLISV